MNSSSEFPVPTHVTVSTWHLRKLEERIRAQAAEIDALQGEVDELVDQRNLARHWARRFYMGWETNESILPNWIRKKGWCYPDDEPTTSSAAVPTTVSDEEV